MIEKVRAVVLLSGSGRTLQNLLDKMATGEWPLDIVAVVSNKKNVRGIDIAEEAGLAHSVFPRRSYADTAAHNAAINDWISPHQPEMIILAGYLSYYIKPEYFTGPIVNIHPALLPKYGGQGFYGDRVHEAVLAAGETDSGCTVHLVDGVYDNGEILGQKRVAVQSSDDVRALADRVFAAECELYPEVLGRLAGKIIAARQ